MMPARDLGVERAEQRRQLEAQELLGVADLFGGARRQRRLGAGVDLDARSLPGRVVDAGDEVFVR
jgi:hypothetical protein